MVTLFVCVAAFLSQATFLIMAQPPPFPIQNTAPSRKPQTKPVVVSATPTGGSTFIPTGNLSIGQPSPSQTVTVTQAAIQTTVLPRSFDTSNVPVTFDPGNFSVGLRSDDNRVKLSNGLVAKRIVQSGSFVTYANGDKSNTKFHSQPDGAAVFSKSNGGWYYVSNAEKDAVGSNWNNGGVGAIEFNFNGKVVGYKRIANNLKHNCSGGKTPWNTWMTCEESDGGQVWQVDPKGVKDTQVSAMGSLGDYESFAYDDSTNIPTFYVTRDASNGVVTRFTPNAKGMACYRKTDNDDRWCTLNHGTRDYLVLSGGSSGTFSWTTDHTVASNNANMYYLNNEGIDIVNGTLFFVSKVLKRLIILDLRKKTYTYSSTKSGAFNSQPDQLARVLQNDVNSILYFCEDGGLKVGVHGRKSNGQFFTILYGLFADEKEETTGLAFSPDGKHMYVSFQNFGGIYDVTRKDGRSFDYKVIDIKYHAVSA